MVKSSRRLCCSRNTLMVVVVFILVTLHAYKTSRQQANPSTFSYNNEENTGDLGFADMLSKTESSVKDWFAAKDITDVRGELNSAIEDLSMGALKYPDQVNGKQDDSIAVRNIRDDDGSNTDGVVFENNNLDQWRKRNEDYEGQNQLIEEQSYHQVEGQSTVEKYIRTPPRPPKCAELGLKSKVKQKDVAKTLMGVCPVFHKQLEFHKGKRVYMPEYNLKFAGNPETTTRKRLMIVCHPDDEVIFGGEELLNHPGEWVVVYITNDHRRPKGVKKMVEALNLNEAIIFGLADSMVDEFKYPIEFVEEIYKLLCSQVWDQIATHGEDGEYGHRQHIALHQIVYHLMQKVGIFANNWTKITDFTLDTKLHRTSNKENIMKRQELCRDIYYRSNKKWMRMIEKSGTVTHRSNTDKSDYDITDLLCE